MLHMICETINDNKIIIHVMVAVVVVLVVVVVVVVVVIIIVIVNITAITDHLVRVLIM